MDYEPTPGRPMPTLTTALTWQQDVSEVWPCRHCGLPRRAARSVSQPPDIGSDVPGAMESARPQQSTPTGVAGE